MGFITTIIPGFINDISPTHLRGVLGYANAILLYSGIIFAFALGLGVPMDDPAKLITTNFWRVMFCVPGVIGFVQMILLLFVFKYESPEFY